MKQDEDQHNTRRGWARWRDGLRQRPAAEFGYRIAVAMIGLAVLAVGIVAIPYPGPGWAIVFVGLGILATEFEWARRLLSYARRRYDKAMAWFHDRHPAIQVLGGLFTALVVALTLWLLGAIGFFAAVLGVEHELLKSPIGFGS